MKIGRISIKMSNYTEVKRQLFDKYYAKLNSKQREAVYTINGALLILAGAGSGKTTVLVNRIAHMIRYGDAYRDSYIPEWAGDEVIDEMKEALSLPRESLAAYLDRFAVRSCAPWSVLCITFTNKAANEMKERLSGVIGEASLDLWAGTFHSICLRLLRRFCGSVGYDSGFTIYDNDDSKKLILSIMKNLHIDDKNLTPKYILNRISNAKDELISPEEFSREVALDSRLRQVGMVYAEYQKELKSANAMDFDDIIVNTVRLLQSDKEAADFCRRRFKYVSVDEFQDTNHAQFELIKLLSAGTGNLMVVGDDDQSIYKFRGATIENILDFDKTFDNVKVIKLEQNYRSTQNILNAANSVIKNNSSRHGKELWTESGDGDKIVIRALDNQNTEARYITESILCEMEKNSELKYSDFAILYRMNAQSNSLEQVFAKSGIPYRILGGLRFFERKEIKDIIAYLCLVSNTNDDLRLKRIINEPKRKIGTTTVDAVEQLANYENVSMFEIMEHAERYTALSRSAPLLVNFTNLIRNLQKIGEEEGLVPLMQKTIEQTGYMQMLLANKETEEDRIDNLNELVSNAVEYCENNEEASLAGFLEDVALVADIDNYDEGADAVVMMTIHSSKGLEFPYVFLPGLEEGVFPGMQSAMDMSELEEERRLAYVAITRAKNKLFCLRARERLLFGRTQYNPESRFLAEIPDKYADREDEKRTSRGGGYYSGNMAAVSSGFGSGYGGIKKSELAARDRLSPELTRGVQPQAKKKPSTVAERFACGQIVSHASFGRGEILSVKDMGGDILYEIAFEKVGTKKLMATYAKLKAEE